jgi:GTP-binding protein Era
MAYKSGYVSIVGKPNVGKSTLLNSIIGQKVSIVSPKAQTTRNSITGIKTLPDAQIVFTDTPGIHKPFHKLGEAMVNSAMASAKDVDVILYMVTPDIPQDDDIRSIRKVLNINSTSLLVINKVDTVKKEVLLPLMSKYTEMFTFEEVIPVSAVNGDGIDSLMRSIIKYLPEGPKFYPDDITTDQLERFLVSEVIREKVMMLTKDEVPHSVAVEVVRWDETSSSGLIKIEVNIYVERESQKGIIIGKGGNILKKVGSLARRELEDLFGVKFFLSTWVKVRKNWREDVTFLKELGLN